VDTANITITEIDLDNTLLLDAVNKGKARFVSDCASYLQVGGWVGVWGCCGESLQSQIDNPFLPTAQNETKHP